MGVASGSSMWMGAVHLLYIGVKWKKPLVVRLSNGKTPDVRSDLVLSMHEIRLFSNSIHINGVMDAGSVTMLTIAV